MLKSLGNAIKWIGHFLQSPVLLLIRLYWGYQFAVAGFGKLMSLDSVTQFFQTLGIPYPYYNAILAGSVEMVGGALLFLGLISRIAAIPLLFVTCVAYYTASHDALVTLIIQFDPGPFFQDSVFLFAYAALLVFCFGPGKISFDYWVTDAHKNKEMP